MKFIPSVITTILAATYCYAATVADIQADVNNINGNITIFNGALSTFTASPTVNLLVQLAVAGQGVVTAGQKAITDAQALPDPVSSTDVSTLATILTALASNAATTLTAIGTAKPQFDSVPMVQSLVSPAVFGVLTFVQSLVTEFEDAILNVVPILEQAALLQAAETINAALDAAIQVFQV